MFSVLISEESLLSAMYRRLLDDYKDNKQYFTDRIAKLGDNEVLDIQFKDLDDMLGNQRKPIVISEPELRKNSIIIRSIAVSIQGDILSKSDTIVICCNILNYLTS